MKGAKFSWVPKSHYRVSAAEAVGKRLFKITERKGGGLCPEDVIEDARKTTSPLHEFFEWNNAKAAHEHRLERARHITRSLVVTYTDVRNTGPQTMRALVCLESRKDEAHTYVPTMTVMSNAAMRKELVAQALRELAGWRKRYAHLKELSNLFDKIDQFDAAA